MQELQALAGRSVAPARYVFDLGILIDGGHLQAAAEALAGLSVACLRYLVGNEQGYVSFLTAMHLHGLISQIPRAYQGATTGRGRILESPIGDRQALGEAESAPLLRDRLRPRRHRQPAWRKALRPLRQSRQFFSDGESKTNTLIVANERFIAPDPYDL